MDGYLLAGSLPVVYVRYRKVFPLPSIQVDDFPAGARKRSAGGESARFSRVLPSVDVVLVTK